MCVHDLSQQHTVGGRGVGDGVRACRDGLANSLILRAAGGDDGDLGMTGAERGDEIVGYAYAGPFGSRAAYDWAVEMSIYLREDQRHRGTGKRLYAALEAVLRAQNIQNLYACIGCPDGADDAHLTRNSAQFHAHLGYRLVGEFPRCGYKFGTWYSMVWMEKCIGAHEAQPAPVRPFPELSPAELEAILDRA